MNAGARKYNNKTNWPYRELTFKDPETKQALQVVDILIGAIAFKLNGHYDKPEAKKAKKELCDYILAKSRIADPFKTTPFYIKRLTILHRDGTYRDKRK